MTAPTATEVDHDRPFPELPPGYEVQPAWGFSDGTGRFVFQFNRVYGGSAELDKRGPVRRLEHDLCYWSVTWAAGGGTAGRWLSFADLRKRGGRMAFGRFSSATELRAELPLLLRTADVPPMPIAT